MRLWKYTHRQVRHRDSHGEDIAFWSIEVNVNRAVVVGALWYAWEAQGRTDIVHLLFGCLELRLERIADAPSEICLCPDCHDLAMKGSQR